MGLDELPLALVMEELLEWEKPKKGGPDRDGGEEEPRDPRTGPKSET